MNSHITVSQTALTIMNSQPILFCLFVLLAPDLKQLPGFVLFYLKIFQYLSQRGKCFFFFFKKSTVSLSCLNQKFTQFLNVSKYIVNVPLFNYFIFSFYYFNKDPNKIYTLVDVCFKSVYIYKSLSICVSFLLSLHLIRNPKHCPVEAPEIQILQLISLGFLQSGQT